MRDHEGGGNPSEGEYIETVEIPITKARDMVFDEGYVKPTGCAFAVMWFLKERYKPSLRELIQTNVLGVGVVTTLGIGALLGLLAAFKQ